MEKPASSWRTVAPPNTQHIWQTQGEEVGTSDMLPLVHTPTIVQALNAIKRIDLFKGWILSMWTFKRFGQPAIHCKQGSNSLLLYTP